VLTPADEPASPGQATQLLIDLRRGGDTGERATAALTELLYPELRQLASRLMRRERDNHTLQPTAVVHEVFLRLVDQQRIDWQDRAHFLGIAARVMRRILVEHARKRDAAKRGGDVNVVTLDEALVPTDDPAVGLLAVDEVLTRLADVDPAAPMSPNSASSGASRCARSPRNWASRRAP
jgi:RNA polymerase sigma factor (TIGR02999 family)